MRRTLLLEYDDDIHDAETGKYGNSNLQIGQGQGDLLPRIGDNGFDFGIRYPFSNRSNLVSDAPESDESFETVDNAKRYNTNEKEDSTMTVVVKHFFWSLFIATYFIS